MSTTAELLRLSAELQRLTAENKNLARAAIRACDVAEVGVRSLIKERDQLRAQRDLLLEALEWIANVNAINYEYQAKAKSVLTILKNNGKI